ncbi:MAG: ribose 5-phosphate isomerase B [Planctomycetota bacterium]
MKIAVGADHAGWKDKEWIAERLRRAGHEVVDFGTRSEEPVDYPDFAVAAARAVARGDCDRGVLVCGTGIGMSMAANKVPGVRAAACQTADGARYSRAHNDANVLCLGSRLNEEDELRAILEAWFDTDFEGGRHERRVNKINALDEGGPC